MKRGKIKGFNGRNLGHCLGFQMLQQFLRNFQNPHMIYTISRINSVSISFETIFNLGENDG